MANFLEWNDGQRDGYNNQVGQMQKSEGPTQSTSEMQRLMEEAQHSRDQLLQNYYELKKELKGLQKESQLFEEWVTQIYLHKLKTADIYFMQGIEINVTPQATDTIIRRVLADVCDTHKELIGEQMRFMLEAGSAEYYYKVDADSSCMGYFESCGGYEWVAESEGFSEPTALRPATRFNVNYQYYEYCVWVIYNHFCSLSECHKEVCQLVQTINRNSEAEFHSFYREMQAKRMIAELEQAVEQDPHLSQTLHFTNKDVEKIAMLKKRAAEALSYATATSNHLYSPSYKELTMSSTVASLDRIAELIDDYDFVREAELNVLTITNLIPLAMPRIDQGNGNFRDDFLLGGGSEQENYQELYQHISKFERAINNIFSKSKQNMKKHCLFLSAFKSAIAILRSRLKHIRIDQHEKKLQRQQQRQRFLQQQLLMEEQYKNDVSKELDRELQAAKQEPLDDREAEEEDRMMVRDLEQIATQGKSGKKPSTTKRETKVQITAEALKSMIQRDSLLKEVTEDKIQRKISTNSTEGIHKKQGPSRFGKTQFLLQREQSKEPPKIITSVKQEKKIQISSSNSFVNSLLSMRANQDQTDTIRKNNRTNNVIKTTTLTTTTTTTTTTSNFSKASKHRQTTMFQKLQKKLKLLIDKDCSNGQEFEAVISHLSGSGLSKQTTFTNSFSDEPLVFTKSHLQKSKFPNPNLTEEYNINKIRHMHQAFNSQASSKLDPFGTEELELHDFIEINNMKNDQEVDENNLDQIDDEEYLDQLQDEQKQRKRNKRKRNKKKKKLQQQQQKQQQEQQKTVGQEKSLSKTHSKTSVLEQLSQNDQLQIDQNEDYELEMEVTRLTRGLSKQSSIEANTLEGKVIKFLTELNINQQKREKCFLIPNQKIRSWQKMIKNNEHVGRNKLVSFSLTPKKAPRGKKSVVKF